MSEQKDEGALLRGSLALIATEARSDLLWQFVRELPAERLAPVIIEAKSLARNATGTVNALEGRYGLEVDTAWQAPNGDVYVWKGERSWQVDDPEGLAQALFIRAQENPLWRPRIREAVKRIWTFDHGILNMLADRDKELANIIREFRKPKYGPPHLRKFE